LLGIIPSILVLVLLVVILVRLIPGTTVDAMLGDFRASKLDRQQLEARLGLDRPVYEQYADYVRGLAHGDLGHSLFDRKSVGGMIFDKLPVTLELTIFAAIVGSISGILLGVLSAVMHNSIVDYTMRSFSVLFLSIPSFVLASASVLLPAVYFGWVPPLFYHHITQDPAANLEQLILPTVVLALPMSATMMRIARTSLLEVLRQDYVRTARSKGLRAQRVIFSHALRNALIPIMTIFGLQVAVLLSGSVIIESIFGLPGIGLLVLDALNQRDYPVIEGITVVLGLCVMLVNLVVDCSYAIIDPRVKGA
jgi:peptide/nickel transport system permease protein